MGIAIAAVREIILPHHAPMPFTLVVLAGVVLVKEVLFRKVAHVGELTGSTAVTVDAWHHRSDALTSAAAFVGIALALWGGPGWETADDWAALAASTIIFLNGARFMRAALDDLMDRAADAAILEIIDTAARAVDGVLATEKLRVRKLGTKFSVDLHVQANPTLSLHDAHILSGRVKAAIRAAVPAAHDVLIHMEPFEE